jgi:RNA-directed DNA polymerase
MASIRAKIRDATDRRFAGFDLEVVAVNLSRKLRGWAAYFRYGNSARKFRSIDSYLHERFAILASTKHGQTGRNWNRQYDWTWFQTLPAYRLSGKVRHGLCMTGDERCRRAVCRRTARTVVCPERGVMGA